MLNKYFKLFVLVSIGGLILCSMASLYAIRSNILGFGYTELVKVQLNKISAADSFDVVILGDSSGGNSVDSKELGRELGRSVVSLSLTGAFGYGGTYFMAERVIEKGVKLILIVQSLDVLQRPTNNDARAILFLSRSFKDLFRSDVSLLLSWDVIWASLKGIIKQQFKMVSSEHYSDQDWLKYNYVPQSKERYRSLSGIRFNSEDIVVGKEKYLQQLSVLCKKSGVECIYAHGPIHDSFCSDDNKEYLTAANKIIVGAGIRFLGGLYCMSDEQVGDSMDHVALEYKKKTTGFYASKIMQR